MNNDRVMKGQGGNEEVSSVLRGLTISPQPERPTDQVGKVRNAGGVLSPQDISSGWFEEGDIRSSESFVGLPLHEEPPTAAERREVVQKDGHETKHGCDSGETRLSSLPTTVLFVEETDDEQSNPTYELPTPGSAESLTSSSDSKQPTDHVESKTEESSGSGSLSWNPNVPHLESILPSSTGSTSGSGLSSDQSSPGEDVKRHGVITTDGDSINFNVAEVQQTIAQVQESLQGFILGSVQDLQEYLDNIVSNQRDFGFYVLDKLKPSFVGEVMCYRLGREFQKLHSIHERGKNCGVFLCRDNRTKHLFILKKIMKTNQRLVGVEFLTRHSKDFLPKIYGVYKEKNTISIFQEYIEGKTLLVPNWNLAKVRQFAEVLLSAVEYLHRHDLVHSDIKLRNLMVRSLSNPETLVMIDFESAKHPSYPYYRGGHTLTYLPPWYEEPIHPEEYHQWLKTVDLWAAACVIIFFLIPSERGELGDVWSQVMKDITGNCASSYSPCFVHRYCSDCRKTFLDYLKKHGHNILHHHLRHLMNARIDDLNWKALRRVLEYLTDTNNIHEKNITFALRILKDPVYCQAAIEFDHDIHNR